MASPCSFSGTIVIRDSTDVSSNRNNQIIMWFRFDVRKWIYRLMQLIMWDCLTSDFQVLMKCTIIYKYLNSFQQQYSRDVMQFQKEKHINVEDF